MLNICGLLLKARPDMVPDLADQIAATPGCDVHATTDDGRLIVVVEDMPDTPAHDRIMALHQLPGVLAVTINYHHFEPSADAAPAALSA